MEQDKYTPIKTLSTSNSSKVSLAIDLKSDQKVIVKEIFLPPSTPLVHRQQLTSEAKILASLRHPNIVKYIDSSLHTDAAILVTEYCEGGDLQAYLKSYPRPNPETIHEVFVQLLLALMYLHDRRLLHRDLKLRNIFVADTRSGFVRIKVGDFGIARHVTAFATTLIGTPYYLSPEICARQPYDLSADIWALGCVLYELATGGRHPFQAVSLSGLLSSIQTSDVDFRGIDEPALRSLLASLLTKDAEKRPSVDDLLGMPTVQQWIREFSNKINKNTHTAKTRTAAKAETSLSNTCELLETMKPLMRNNNNSPSPNSASLLGQLQTQMDQAANFNSKWISTREQSESIRKSVDESLARILLLPSRVAAFKRALGVSAHARELLAALNSLFASPDVTAQLVCAGLIGDALVLLRLENEAPQ
jgi:serine/threonine protein kinase